jgi:hypothetical protein
MRVQRATSTLAYTETNTPEPPFSDIENETHCLWTVGLISNKIQVAHAIPRPASDQYALMKMGCRSGIVSAAPKSIN